MTQTDLIDWIAEHRAQTDLEDWLASKAETPTQTAQIQPLADSSLVGGGLCARHAGGVLARSGRMRNVCKPLAGHW